MISPLGLRLRAIRKRFLDEGGLLLDREELVEEIAGATRGASPDMTKKKTFVDSGVLITAFRAMSRMPKWRFEFSTIPIANLCLVTL